MSINHYQHLETKIIKYFRNKDLEILIEPHGSQGADIESVCGSVIGEIKHAEELARDLKSFYWSAWNSKNQSFGGKTKDYRLKDDFVGSVDSLIGEVKGWIAVIYGQLRYYCQKNFVSEGWIIYEEYSLYRPSLDEAIKLLYSESMISFSHIEEYKNIGFGQISFC